MASSSLSILRDGIWMLHIRGKHKESKDKLFYLSNDNRKLQWGKSKQQHNLVGAISPVITRSSIAVKDVKAIYIGQGTQTFADTVDIDGGLLKFNNPGELKTFISAIENLSGKKATSPPRAIRVFGLPLSRDPKCVTPPKIIKILVKYIHDNGLRSKGIFRLSAAQDDVNFLEHEYDAGNEPDLDKVCDDVHAIAGLLKLWLRRMPEPLLTHEFYGLFVAVQGIPDQKVVLERISKLLDLLPASHTAVLNVIIHLMSEIAQFSNENMMTASNLAVVLTPNILRSAEEESGDVSVMVEDMPMATKLVETLIVHYDAIFADYLAALATKKPPPPPPKPRSRLSMGVQPQSKLKVTAASASGSSSTPRSSSRPVPPPKPSLGASQRLRSVHIGGRARSCTTAVPERREKEEEQAEQPTAPASADAASSKAKHRFASKWDPGALTVMLDTRVATEALEARTKDKDIGRKKEPPSPPPKPTKPAIQRYSSPSHSPTHGASQSQNQNAPPVPPPRTRKLNQ